MDKFKCGPILLASWVLFSSCICVFANVEKTTTPISNVSSEVSAMDQVESTRSPRSIGNIARLLLGGTYVMVQLGHMPPDHPLVKYPKPIQTARSNTQSVLAAVPGMNGAPFPFPMPVHHSGLPIGRPTFGIGPIPVQSVPSMSYAQLMKHKQPPISPSNPLNAQQHPEKWKEMHSGHDEQRDSFSSSSSSPSLPYNYNRDSPDYTSSTYYTTTGPISSGSNDHVQSSNPNHYYHQQNFNHASSSENGAQSEQSPGIHYPGHRYNPETNSYSAPLFMDFPSPLSSSSSSYSHPIDSSSSFSAHSPYSSQYSSPPKDYEASFNAEMYLSGDYERPLDSPDQAPISSHPYPSEPAVSSSSIHPQQQPLPPNRPEHAIYLQQFPFNPPTRVTPVQIPQINNYGYTQQQPQIQHSSVNNFYSSYPHINSLPNNNNNGYSSSSYSSQNVSPVNNYHNNLPQQSVIQLSGTTIPTTIATLTTTTTTTTTTLPTKTTTTTAKSNYNNHYQHNSRPTSASSAVSNYDSSHLNYDGSTTFTTLNNYNNNNKNISPPPQNTRTKNRVEQVTSDKVHSSSLKINYDPSFSHSYSYSTPTSSHLLVKPTASNIKLATERYETISVPTSKSTSHIDKYYSKQNSKTKNKSDERSDKKKSKSSSSSSRRHHEEYKVKKNSESYEDEIPPPSFSSSSKKSYKEIIRTSESASGSESTEVGRIQVDEDNLSSSRHRSAEKEKRPHNPDQENHQKVKEYESSSSNTRPHYNPGNRRSSSSSNKYKGVKPYYYSNENSYRKYKGNEFNSNTKHYKTGKTEPPKINYKDFSSSYYFSKGSNPRKSYSNSNPYHHKSSSSFKSGYSKYYLPPASKSSGSPGGRSSSSSSIISTHPSSKHPRYPNHDDHYYRNDGVKKSKENFADLISDDDFEVIFAKRRLEIVDENKENKSQSRGVGRNNATKSTHPHMRRTFTPIQNHNTQRKSYGKPNLYSPSSFPQSPQNRNRNRNNKHGRVNGGGEAPGRVHTNGRDNSKKSTKQMENKISHLNPTHPMSSLSSSLSSLYSNSSPQNLPRYNQHKGNSRQKSSSPSPDLSSGKRSSFENMQNKQNPPTWSRTHRAITDSESHEKQQNISNVTLNQSTINPIIKQ